MQALIPARHIGAKALYFGSGMKAETFLDLHKPSILIITKMMDDEPLKLAAAAKQRKIPVVGIFCDLHIAGMSGNIGSAEMADRNKLLCELIAAAVAPTKYVAELTSKHYGIDCGVIEEAIEYPRCDPTFLPSSPIKVLYTGHPSNHDTLVTGVRLLARFSDTPLNLMIVSSRAPDIEAIKKAAPKMQVGFIPWSPLNQFHAFQFSDVVFVPSKDEPAKHAKGQLRVLSAIQMGKIAIAFPLPQYLELKDYCYCGTEYAELLKRAIQRPDEVRQKILAGQECIDQRFSGEACGDKWSALIKKLTA